MIPALLILAGSAVTVAAIVALFAGTGFGTVAIAYLSAGLLLSLLIVLSNLLRGSHAGRDSRYYSEVEAEMIALRESAAGDRRFGSGSPEALSPVLHRSLIAREEALERAAREDSELLIRVRR